MRYAAGCLIVARDDASILLLRRSSRVSHAGEWGLPGGGNELSDLGLRGTAWRETSEETHLQPRFEGLLAVEQSPKRTYATFLGSVSRAQEPLLNWEHDGYVWAPLQRYGGWDVPEPLYATDHGRLGVGRLLADPDTVAAALVACRGRRHTPVP